MRSRRPLIFPLFALFSILVCYGGIKSIPTMKEKRFAQFDAWVKSFDALEGEENSTLSIECNLPSGKSYSYAGKTREDSEKIRRLLSLLAESNKPSLGSGGDINCGITFNEKPKWKFAFDKKMLGRNYSLAILLRLMAEYQRVDS